MVKKLELRMITTITATTVITALIIALKRRLLVEEDNITNKFPPKVMNITLRFADLPQEDIIQIIYNKS